MPHPPHVEEPRQGLRRNLDEDPWARLRRSTPARIGLGRSGDAVPTRALLDFQLAHARARDAVHGAVDFAGLARQLAPLPTRRVHSAAADRATYLRRPDLGRLLSDEAAERLAAGTAEIAFVVADGLSASAVARHAVPTLRACLERIDPNRVAPIVLAEQARVAIGDPIGARLGVRLVAVLIGERPGLSVGDSLGIYLTIDPSPGRSDAERNCISNVHGGGLTYAQAADRLVWLMAEALRIGVTGVQLKDGSPGAALISAPAVGSREEPPG